MERGEYYLGLDIGTDSVGYAVTDMDYKLKKFHREPMWGVTTFDPAEGAEGRRGFRTARRRLDRRQMRIRLLEELFAREIAAVDRGFFIRLKQSGLCREDADGKAPFILFNDTGYNDSDYYKQYPTVHHLILALLKDEAPQDVRLVYIACAWLVAHRGHFLNEMSKENLDAEGGFENAYREFICFFEERGYELPWEGDRSREILDLLIERSGVRYKTKRFADLLYGGKIPKLPKEPTEDELEAFPFDREAIIKLLSGGEVKPDALFKAEELDSDLPKLKLDKDEDSFADMISGLGGCSDLVIKLRAMRDAASLVELLNGRKYISESKVLQYEKHKEDLEKLKAYIRKYFSKDEYKAFFRHYTKGVANYTAYSGNIKDVKGDIPEFRKATVKDFSEHLKKLLLSKTPDDADREYYETTLARLETFDFMPKQVQGENRIIPYQVYWLELRDILVRAEAYLPFLAERDEEGLSVSEKILSIFEYRIPYFVGPLHRSKGQKAFWLERKEKGRILPWNFDKKIDLDKTEDGFIENLTNRCTYLIGEDVLPKDSLVYSKFCVLNEINNLTANGAPITVEWKQRIFEDLFMCYRRVTVKKIKDYLVSNGVIKKDATLGGIDTSVKSSLSSYHDFRSLLSRGILTEADAEEIIKRSAYAENKTRFRAWLRREYPTLEENDVNYVSSKTYSGFGRLSYKFLTGLYGARREGGEAFTVMELLYSTNENLMQILSSAYTFRESIEAENSLIDEEELSVDERLEKMYVPTAVRRPILRALDIIADVRKATGGDPKRIYIEMARGATPEQKNSRTKTRLQQILDLYSKVKDEHLPELRRELEAMGAEVNNRLQSDKLFLYFIQLGRCMYSKERIELSELMTTKLYDIDHIYPQHFVKDDSVLNNRVLVTSIENGNKGDRYPIDAPIREKMSSFWKKLLDCGLITEEKYKRLVRSHAFTDDEKMGFINRQLVETRQSTKALATILKEMLPETEIVYVKAGLVSDFRHKYGILKSRTLNDLHHAKDAYLNIVVGNVYNAYFNYSFFRPTDEYSMKIEKIFARNLVGRAGCRWRGEEDIGRVKKIYSNNSVRVTRYPFKRGGGFFDQMPVKAKEGLVPRKKDLPTEIYGGYNKPSAAFFVAVRYKAGKKSGIIILSVDLLVSKRFLDDNAFALEYARDKVAELISAVPNSVEFVLGKRIIRVNSILELDGLRMCISGKSGGGTKLIVQTVTPFICDTVSAEYVRVIEKFNERRKDNPSLVFDPQHSLVNEVSNLALYELYIEKLSAWPFNKRPANPVDTLKAGKEKFLALGVVEQAGLLGAIHQFFARYASGVDLRQIGGVGKAGVTMLSSSVENWKKTYTDVRLVDQSPSGLFEHRSENLLALL